MKHGAARVAAGAGALALVLWSGAAQADAIDGEWCGPDGRRLSIAGPVIVTPGGTRMEGAYTRHSFVYTEPQGGQEVQMQLLGETAVRIRFGSGDESGQVWRRCTATTS